MVISTGIMSCFMVIRIILIVVFTLSILVFGACTKPPVADFDIELSTVFVGEQVRLIDRSLGGIESWYWDLGDGTTNSDQEIIHIYTMPGNYIITLTVTNSVGSDNLSRSIKVIPEFVKADFSVSTTSATIGKAIQFSDKSTGNIESWLWDFGDGSISTKQHPYHVYQKAGTYSVSLTVYDVTGSDTKEIVDYINVSDFTIRLLTVCSEVNPEGYITQPNATFQIGDDIWIYFEVVGFEREMVGELATVWLKWTVLKITDPNGQVIIDLKSTDLKEFHETMNIALDDFVQFVSVIESTSSDLIGKYEVEVQVEDMLNGDSAVSATFFKLDQ
jgi:PKD repeat protein